ncbi:MAG: nickel-dependent hydrogenase large subunit [Thermodesulfobacteriota bacterium]
MARTILPFGPQHPVLPEPIHLKLVVEDEIVLEALPALGYVHRGLEKLCEIKDINQMVQVVERVCGICSCLHAVCYCQGIEGLVGLDVPPRAKFLRVIWGELHRMHSHLLWLGLFADAFGFESLFMQFWKVRERIMDIMEATCGNRVVISVNVIGGVRRDLSPEQCAWVLDQLALAEKDIKRLSSTILNDYTVCKRTKGKGVLTAEQAIRLGAAGPTLRGSGVAQDARQEGYAAYSGLEFSPVTEPDGDSYARGAVRFRETLQSIDLVRQAISRMPGGEIFAPSKAKPQGEITMRVEQPRGELFYYIKADGTKNLDRLRIRTPTFANIPPLLAMLPGIELADVPVVVLSIDPCISCTER